MILYGLKNCDSCKKALAQLRAVGHEVAFVDIRTEPMDAKQLADLLAHHGADILLNRKSTSWRNLDETSRSLPPQTQMTQHPTLIKRPVIYTETGSFVGWSREVQKACGL
jgi:arsenate reductase